MPGTPVPTSGFDPLRARFEALERRLSALETQQQQVIADPTGASGDAAHGHAVVVLGSLQAICAIPAFGIASHKTGTWTQL